MENPIAIFVSLSEPPDVEARPALGSIEILNNFENSTAFCFKNYLVVVMCFVI